MVQVDVIWAYSFGATFAACASRQLKKQPTPFNNKWYTFNLLFLSIFFVPSGLYLLCQFVQWETMQAARALTDLPAWLVCGFAVTNITQGILGYWVSYKFIQRGNYYAAHANWMWAWILFWFVLVCGWDCTGYQRFLYDASANNGVPWAPGHHMGYSFFWKSNVWWTLVGMGVCFLPMLAYGIVGSIEEGLAHEPGLLEGRPQIRARLVRSFAFCFGTQWVVCLGLAIVAALIVMGMRDMTGCLLLGYLIGIPLFVGLAQILLFRRGMPMHLIAKQLYIKDVGE